MRRFLFLQCFDIGHQFGCNFLHARIRLFCKGVFDTVEASNPASFAPSLKSSSRASMTGSSSLKSSAIRFDTFVMDAGGGKQEIWPFSMSPA